MQVLSSHNDGSGHFGCLHTSLENAATNADQTSEWAFSVNVITFDCFFWGLESQTNVLPPSSFWKALTFGAATQVFITYEHIVLLLKRMLSLNTIGHCLQYFETFPATDYQKKKIYIEPGRQANKASSQKNYVGLFTCRLFCDAFYDKTVNVKKIVKLIVLHDFFSTTN
ncbi:hypothetical protein RFI_27351 [Reticulomyxa filosa]|uniref:Uncharacterized protein n=1 Tax=Reticulomyxa filosa TaxID=46433 RepID=X6M972_RETFI|nr:hypothetical protein RFI_27351 [Reticulomyxa filosa]|eukprot:ETO10027.1 hypothetical protein RFI_27351 [Reticulomyxa filosa]